MKKFLTLILAFCLCLCCVPLFAACDEEEEKYWLDTDVKFNTFLEQEVTPIVDGYEFGEKINSNIENAYATYAELDVIYSPLFNVSIGFLSDFSECFKIAPFAKNTKKNFQEFNKDIDTMSAKLKSFKEESIPTFVEGVKGTSQEDAESTISLQYLKNFKRQYIDLSTSVLEFAEKLLNLYTAAYQDIPSLYDGENFAELSAVEIQNYTRLALSKTIIYSLLPAIDYINSFNGTYIYYEHDNYVDIIESYKNIIENKQDVAATTETLYAFCYTYDSYKNDVEIFRTALKNIDMPLLAGEDYEFDCFKYSKGNSQNYANATKALMFSEDSMYVLKEKLLALYNI